MTPTAVYPIFTTLLAALGTTWLISRKAGIRPAEVSYISIDGLRGYLAFFVFIHHTSIWLNVIKYGAWQEPGLNLYNHFGQTSVSLFFMITGFLFFGRLFSNEKKPVNWKQYGISRVMRLAPLYLFAMFILFIYVAYVSGFKLVEPLSKVAADGARWMGFTLFGMPWINQAPYMGYMIAGVTWSLIYEWLFYFSLPIIGMIFFRARVPVLISLLSIFMVYQIWIHNMLPMIHIYTFGGGFLAAYLVRSARFVKIAVTKTASVIALLSVSCSVYFFHSAYSWIPLLLNAITFIIIACGNTLFGLLALPVSRLFGQLSYGIYLLQGLFLYLLFRIIFGMEAMSHFSADVYWLLMTGATVIFISICYAAHLFIELPGIKAGARFNEWISRRSGK